MNEDTYEIIGSNAEELREQMQDKFQELSGREISKFSPEGLIFASVAYLIAMREENYNDNLKQNYLKYARDNRLDLLGDKYGDRGLRLDEQYAKATFRFHIISPKQKKIVIPKGSLIRYNELYFETNEEYSIAENTLYIDGIATCKTAGTIGNNIPIGHINTMVDLYPYFSKVENITISNGGTDLEEDEDYRERLRLVPDSFSVAGSEGAYIFWTLSTSPEIIDVTVKSPNPCEVDIYVLTKDGIPTQEMKNQILKVVNSDEIRPLTDKVTIKSPDIIDYNVEFDYYINKTDEININSIKSKVQNIVNEYVEWQKNKLGRDIIPDELIKRLKLIGVKRTVITSPTYKKLEPHQFAKCGSIVINYLGVEDI